MVTTNLQAGGEVSERDEADVLVIGAQKWSFGPTGPILRALGIGFALGAILTGIVAVFAQ